MISMLSSLGDVPAEVAFCFATGNTARMRALDCGIIEVGRAADFVFMDKAQHSSGKDILDSVRLGDLPGVGMTVIDGLVRSQRSRNTPPAGKVPVVVAH
jgi:enamidase